MHELYETFSWHWDRVGRSQYHGYCARMRPLTTRPNRAWPDIRPRSFPEGGARFCLDASQAAERPKSNRNPIEGIALGEQVADERRVDRAIDDGVRDERRELVGRAPRHARRVTLAREAPGNRAAGRVARADDKAHAFIGFRVRERYSLLQGRAEQVRVHPPRGSSTSTPSQVDGSTGTARASLLHLSTPRRRCLCRQSGRSCRRGIDRNDFAGDAGLFQEQGDRQGIRREIKAKTDQDRLLSVIGSGRQGTGTDCALPVRTRQYGHPIDRTANRVPGSRKWRRTCAATIGACQICAMPPSTNNSAPFT